MSSGDAASEVRGPARRHSRGHRSSGRRGSSRRYFGRYSKRQLQKALYLSVVVAVSLFAGYLASL